MMTMTKPKMALTGLGATGAVLALTPGTAHADLNRVTMFTQGGHADCTIITDDSYGGAPDSHLNFRCDIFDDSADGDSIYVDYHRNNYAPARRECPTDSGCNLGVDYRGDGAGGLSIYSFTWQVCRNDFPFGDPCSAEHTVIFNHSK